MEVGSLWLRASMRTVVHYDEWPPVNIPTSYKHDHKVRSQVLCDTKAASAQNTTLHHNTHKHFLRSQHPRLSSEEQEVRVVGTWLTCWYIKIRTYWAPQIYSAQSAQYPQTITTNNINQPTNNDHHHNNKQHQPTPAAAAHTTIISQRGVVCCYWSDKYT